MTFQDLILRFDPIAESERYHLVTHSPAEGQVFAPFVSPFGNDRIRTWQGGLHPDETQMIGSLLYKRLFPPEIYQAFEATRRFAERQGFALRLKLIVDDVLDTLPWEFLFDPESNQFLTLEQRIPIVRYLDTQFAQRKMPVADELEVIYVGDDMSAGANAARSFAFTNLNSSFAVQAVSPKELVSKASRFHAAQILHIEGKAGHDPAMGEMGICIPEEHGPSQWVGVDQLAVWVRANPGIRLVFLDASPTETGTRGAASLAAELVARQIVPAALAPQFPLNPMCRNAFVRAFYGTLARGGLLDLAMTEGRHAIAKLNAQWEWGAPVLYSALREDKAFAPLPKSAVEELTPDVLVADDSLPVHIELT